MGRLTWITRYCPHLPERRGFSHAPYLSPTSVGGILRFGFANYRLSLLLPAALLAAVSYGIGWIPFAVSWLGQDLPGLPYALLLFGMPLSFLCLLIQLSMTRDLTLGKRIELRNVFGFVRRFWVTALLVSVAYLASVAIARYAYSALFAPLVAGLASPSLPWYLPLYSECSMDVTCYVSGMPDLYSMGTYSGGNVLSLVLLIVPLNLFYWLALTAGAFEGSCAIDSMRLALQTLRRKWKYVIPCGLIVAAAYALFDVLPGLVADSSIDFFHYGYEIGTILGNAFGLSFYVMKVLLAPLLFLWVAAIYRMHRTSA